MPPFSNWLLGSDDGCADDSKGGGRMTLEELRTLPIEEQLEYARWRWMEGLRNGVPGEITFWQGYLDGLKIQAARLAVEQEEKQ